MKFSNSLDFNEVRRTINNVLDDAQNALKIPERRIGISSTGPRGYKVMVNNEYSRHFNLSFVYWN